MAEIASRAWPTVSLVGVAAILSAVIGVLLGIVAAWNRGRKSDYAATSFTMTTYSMPDFWLGMLLFVAFAVELQWFPVGGMSDPSAPDSGLGHVLDVATCSFRRSR